MTSEQQHGQDPAASEEAAGAPADETVEPSATDPLVGDASTEGDDELAALERRLSERTADLQRLQAEYVNYRKRVERDRAVSRQQGEVAVLRSLLTVLDDLGRAEQHGELEGGFKAVADALGQAVRSHKLEAFGEAGDAFDPRLHEALFHAGESADVEVTTVQAVVRTGYRVGDEVVRHAQVGVVEPGSAPAEPADAPDQD